MAFQEIENHAQVCPSVSQESQLEASLAEY